MSTIICHIKNSDNSYNIVITYIYIYIYLYIYIYIYLYIYIMYNIAHYVIINKVCYLNVICHILHNYVLYKSEFNINLYLKIYLFAL